MLNTLEKTQPQFTIAQLRKSVRAMARRYPDAKSDLLWLEEAMGKAVTVEIMGEIS